MAVLLMSRHKRKDALLFSVWEGESGEGLQSRIEVGYRPMRRNAFQQMFGASLKAPSRTFSAITCPDRYRDIRLDFDRRQDAELVESRQGLPGNRPVYFDDARGNFNRVERGEIQKRYIVIP